MWFRKNYGTFIKDTTMCKTIPDILLKQRVQTCRCLHKTHCLSKQYPMYTDYCKYVVVVVVKSCIVNEKRRTVLVRRNKNENEPSFYTKVACTFLKYYMEAIISGVREMFVYDVKSFSS